MIPQYSPQNRCAEIIEVEKRIAATYIFETFKDILLWICVDINEKGFVLNYRSDDLLHEMRSSVEFSPEKEVWIHFKASIGKELLWDLIHEYGHVVCGEPELIDKGTKNWELLVWSMGWGKINSLFPRLKEHEKEYLERATYCANSYPDA